MNFGRAIEKQERKLQLNYNREMTVQRMIRKKLSKLDFSNFGPQNALNLEKLKTEKRDGIHHLPKVLHQKPAPHISRNEVLRLISSASKLIVATEIRPEHPYKKYSSKRTMKIDTPKGNGTELKWTEYEVTVCTGNCLSLGSKADISISFYGEKDKVKDVLLCNSLTNPVPFQSNQTDVFLVEIQDVGKLKYIKVGYDRNEPGQSGKDKRRTKPGRVGCKVALEPQGVSSRLMKQRPHMATNKTPAYFHSSTSSADNSDQVFSHQKPLFSLQKTLRYGSPIPMEKSSPGVQLEFCSQENQISLTGTTKRQPASRTPLKNKDIFKGRNSIDNRSKINDENTQNFTYSAETKVSKKIDKFTCTEDIQSNCAKLSPNDDGYCGEIDQLLPGRFMEDVVQSDSLGSRSEEEWSEAYNSSKCILEVPHFVRSPLEMTSDIEHKPMMAETQYPPENSIHSIDRNIEFVENARTSLLQEGKLTAEITTGLIPSAINNLESLRHVPNSESNSGWGVEELSHTEPLKKVGKDQVEEPMISEVSKTDDSAKEGNSATELTDQNAICDTRETNIMDESTHSVKQNAANISSTKTGYINLCDVFENTIQTIKDRDHCKLEDLCQYYSGLPCFSDDAGRSLLHMAAIYGNGETCQILLQNSDVQKQINSQDKEGRTALHYGIMHNNKIVKRLLLNNGALTDIPDNNLETALDLAPNMINVGEIDNN
ncbi:uncharacterized protein [Mobula birostris]|uniref:uncharacterized protein isoform X4 n=1 Tax=Mobula birostris TaxID=1983395 RepID=UPI003B28D019